MRRREDRRIWPRGWNDFGGALTRTCGVSPEVLSFLRFAIAGGTMLLGAAAIGLVLPFGDFVWPSTPKAWTLVAGLGFVSTLMPFWTWNTAKKYL